MEGVITGIAEDHRRREVVVKHKSVVPVTTVDLDRSADITIVIDPLNDATLHRLAILIDLNGRHHTLADLLVCPQQEEIRLVCTEDPQPVNSRITPRFIKDIDA